MLTTAADYADLASPQSPASPVAGLKEKWRNEKRVTNALRWEATHMMTAFLESAGVTAESPGPGFLAVDLSNVSTFVCAAVAVNGLALRHASTDLKDDRDIVLTACDNDGRALQHASPRLRDDLEVASVAVTRCASALEYAGPVPRGDRGLVIAAVQHFGCK